MKPGRANETTSPSASPKEGENMKVTAAGVLAMSGEMLTETLLNVPSHGSVT